MWPRPDHRSLNSTLPSYQLLENTVDELVRQRTCSVNELSCRLAFRLNHTWRLLDVIRIHCMCLVGVTGKQGVLETGHYSCPNALIALAENCVTTVSLLSIASAWTQWTHQNDGRSASWDIYWNSASQSPTLEIMIRCDNIAQWT